MAVTEAAVVCRDNEQRIVNEAAFDVFIVNPSDQTVGNGDAVKMFLCAVAVAVTGPIDLVKLDKQHRRVVIFQIIADHIGQLVVALRVFVDTEIVFDDAVVDRIPAAE